MRQALALFLSIAAFCLLVSAIFIPTVHGQGVPQARINLTVYSASNIQASNQAFLIPVTGASNLPRMETQECTPATHRETLLCGKDMIELLSTEGQVPANLLLLVPLVTTGIITLSILKITENSARKNTLLIAAGIVAVAAVIGWWLLGSVTGELPDVGFWLIVIAAALTFAASLLAYSPAQSKTHWVEERLNK